MSNYYIQKPNKPILGAVLKRLLFPPLLIWDLSKYIFNALLGEFFAKVALLPALEMPRKSVNDIILPKNNKSLKIQRHEIYTHDGAVLDTIHIHNCSQKNCLPEHKQYVIDFCGNLQCYTDSIHEKLALAQNINRDVILFNYRGVVTSSGTVKSVDDLIVDGIAQVQRLLNEGASPSNITLKGMSLGGALVSEVGRYFHQNNQKVNVFADRPLSSVTNFIVALIRTLCAETGHKENTWGIFLGWIAKPFIKFGVSLVKMEIEAGDAFEAIPAAYREYTVVRSNKTDRKNTRTIDDTVIRHYASFHTYLKKERENKKEELDKLALGFKTLIKEGDLLLKDKIVKGPEKIDKIKESLKARKMQNTHVWCRDGHAVSLDCLQNRYGETGSQFFKQFVEKAKADHGVLPSFKT